MLKMRLRALLSFLLSMTFYGMHNASELRHAHSVYPYTTLFQSQHISHQPLRVEEIGAGTLSFSSHRNFGYADIQQAKNDIELFSEAMHSSTYLEDSIAKQITQIKSLPYVKLQDDRACLTQELETLHKHTSDAQDNEYQLLSQMKLPFSTTALTAEQEKAADPRFVRAYYNNKLSIQSLRFQIAQKECLLHHNEMRTKTVEMELKKAKDAFNGRISDSRQYEGISDEVVKHERMVKLAKDTVKLQAQLGEVTKAIDGFGLLDVWIRGKGDKLAELKHTKAVLEKQIKDNLEAIRLPSVEKIKDALHAYEKELDNLKEIDAYKERCISDYVQIQDMYRELVDNKALGKDAPLFEEIRESLISQGIKDQDVTQLTTQATKWLEHHNIDVEEFESLRGDTTQKLLMDRLCKMINERAKTAEDFRDKAVDKCTRLLGQSIEVAQQAIKKGTPYQALAWTKLSEAIDKATYITTAGIKGVMSGLKSSAQFYSDLDFDPFYTADQFLEICSFCFKVCERDPIALEKIYSMSDKFMQLPRDKQIEQSVALFTNLLSPDPKIAAFKNLDKTLNSMHDVMKCEAEALNNLSELEKTSTVSVQDKKVLVPGRWEDDIRLLIKDGWITTSDEVTRWVEYLEAPLLSPLNQALIEFGKTLSHTTTVEPSEKTVRMALHQAALQVETKERAARTEAREVTASPNPSISDALRPFSPTKQLIPPSETQKAHIKQLHDHYQRVTPHVQSKFVPYREQRIKALADTPSTEVIHRTYQLLPVSEKWVREKGVLHTDAWKTCKGSALNQEIHSELVALVNEAGTLHYASKNEHVHVITDTLAGFIKLAHEANERNAIPETCKITDLCWSLLDYGCAVGEGVVEGASHVADMVTHPGKTIQGIGQAAYNLAYLLCEYEAIGDITCSAGERAAQSILDANGRKIHEIGKALNHALATTSGRDLVKAGAAMATEAWLTGKVVATAKPLFDVAKSRILEVTKKVWEGAAPEVALAGEAEIRIAVETYDQLALMQAEKAKRASAGVHAAAAETVQAEVKAAQVVKEVERVAPTSTVSEVKPAVMTQAVHMTEETAKKIWAQSKELKALEDVVSKLKSTKNLGRVEKLERDTISVLQHTKYESEAKTIFESIRKMSDDISKISKGTGIPEDIIKKIKNHVFYEEHVLFGGKISKFDPGIDMGKAWLRLIDGQYVQSDLNLLLHEYAELLLMNGDKIGYEMAHSIVEKTYSWWNFF